MRWCYQIPKWKEPSISTPHGRRFFYFHIQVECAQYLLGQLPYEDHMVSGQTWTTDAKGDCVYFMMNSADWCWEMKDIHSPGATMVPVIVGSDKTQLIDLSGKKQDWPTYPTIGNIYSSISNKYSYLGQIVLAFLPVPPKFHRNSASDHSDRRDIHQQVLCDIAEVVVEPVT